MLGQFSAVFKRQAVCGPGDPAFYNSFTLTVQDGERTIDCVTETSNEFDRAVGFHGLGDEFRGDHGADDAGGEPGFAGMIR